MRSSQATILCCLVLPIACTTVDARDGDATAPSRSPAPTEPPAAAGGAPGGGNGGSSADGGAADAADAAEQPLPYVAFDINHVVSTGQSNSVAHEGRPLISTAQPFDNLMFDVGVMTSGVCEAQGCRTYQTPTGFVPLTEGDTFWYPVETMSSGLANQAAMLARTKHGKPTHDLLVSLAGRNGLTYWCLRKGTCNFVDPTYLIPFDESLKQVTSAKALATAAGKTYVVRAVTAIHGESDDYGYAVGTPEFPIDGTDGSYRSITSYGDGLLEWQRDYEAGIKAITGQTQPVPLLISQFSGWNDVATSAVTQFQYEAHVRSNGKVVLVTPAYVLDWASDCRHTPRMESVSSASTSARPTRASCSKDSAGSPSARRRSRSPATSSRRDTTCPCLRSSSTRSASPIRETRASRSSTRRATRSRSRASRSRARTR